MQKNSPILIHVPHSSTFIPPEEKHFFLKDDLSDEIMKMTDLYTDELFSCGRDMLTFPVSRLVCDVERFRDDGDEPMAEKGMGLAYTKCADGAPLRNVSPQKRAAIVRKYYDPYHESFTDMVNEKLHECGKCVIIDGHSFSAEQLPYETDPLRPDFCIGTDSFHTPVKLLHTCVTFLRSCGFKVAVNRPFSGTIVPVEHLHSDINVDSIMIEVNRRLYVDSSGNKTDMFPVIERVINSLVEQIEEIYDCKDMLKH